MKLILTILAAMAILTSPAIATPAPVSQADISPLSPAYDFCVDRCWPDYYRCKGKLCPPPYNNDPECLKKCCVLMCQSDRNCGKCPDDGCECPGN
ncbi:hypothetical protein K504DRAFT_461527 [Pleomassaria siparia CBS 279.74]|uniref:Uncharacterized protein n=1 Tax=Pleomassaria siparia CBS 279.74 TaxID=1314801 RepID=A0A6G1KJH9_9PLEO|nr:hypothetical protein K504DRAFT_461527 [Pleomassaria siparia CBS 279.74]